MISFEHPGNLFLASVVPLGIYLMHFWRGRGGRIRFSFAKWQGEAFTYPNLGIRFLRFLSHLAFWIGVTAIILGTAGPMLVERKTVYLNRGKDIMVVIDQSPSMSARDFQPENRFEAAKEVIRTFVDGRANDAIGLVGFGKDAALRVPPTLDRGSLLDRLSDLRILELGDGTAIGMGLAVASMHLERSGAADRIIVLITDGENNAGDILPETAADLAARIGIRVYAIGVGTQGEVPIEYTDPETGTIRRGMFESRFDEELLTGIAERTGGAYYPAKSPGALNAVFRSIDRIETTEKRARITVLTTPLYRWFAMVGLMGLVLSFLIRVVLLREVLA